MPDCIFCRIASGDIPADIVKRSDGAVAFRDLNPQAPVHILAIPVQHVASARDADPDMLGHLVAFATGVASDEGLDQNGYRLVLNTGPHAGQSVFHLHLHLLGGREMKWPPG